MAYCEACGARLLPGARFCEGCGAPLLAEPPTRRASAAGSSPHVVPVEHGATVPAPESLTRPHRTGLVVMAGTAGVLLGVVLVLAFVLFVGRGTQPQQESAAAAITPSGPAGSTGEVDVQDTAADVTVTATVTESPSPTATSQSGTSAPGSSPPGQGGSALPAGQYRLLCASSPSYLPKMFNESSSRQGARLAQYSLRAVGLWPAAVYPSYDASTRRAVRRFQAKVGAEVDGLTGPETWGRFQAVLCGQ